MEERKIQDVIDAVIAELPEGYDDLKNRFAAIKESASYCPPEGMYQWWIKFSTILNSVIEFPPIINWQKNIYKIVTTKDAKDIGTQIILKPMIIEKTKRKRNKLVDNCFVVKVNKKAMETLLYITNLHSNFIRTDEPMSDFIGVYNVGSDHYYVCESKKMGIKIG